MKHLVLLFLTILVLLLAPAAMAEQAVDPAALQAIQSAHPSFTIEEQAQCGNTAAAALTSDGFNILCVAEKQGGAWRVTADSVGALLQTDWLPQLVLDTENSLTWIYQEDIVTRSEYHAEKIGGEWGNVTLNYIDIEDEGYYEHVVALTTLDSGKVISKTNRHVDNSGRVINQWTDIPIPAEGMMFFDGLEQFEADRFPTYDGYSRGWIGDDLVQNAATALMPGYTFQGGTIYSDNMTFLMKDPNGALVFVGVGFDDREGWLKTTSTVLPDGTRYGRENLDNVLWLPDGQMVEVTQYADGSWGPTVVYDDGGVPICYLGQNWVQDDAGHYVFGIHPWTDVRIIGWETLPLSAQDALRQTDPANIAVVHNPDPNDRLHLRMEPNRNATSMGKYYNNTPVYIYDKVGDWYHVSVFGVEGYMLGRYLETGEGRNSVATAGPWVTAISYPVKLYEGTQSTGPFYSFNSPGDESGLRVIGLISDTFYHVWDPTTGLSGYILQSVVAPSQG